MLRQKLGAQENESVRLQQLLDIEKDVHAQAKDDVKVLRTEHKDLMAHRTRDASMVAAAEDLRKQWEHVQVCGALASLRTRSLPSVWTPCLLVSRGMLTTVCNASLLRMATLTFTVCSLSATRSRVPW